MFDREGNDGKFIPVLVKAKDGGTPPLETFCTFLVEIVDVDDNWPYFEKSLYEATVDENEDLTRVVLTVTANDIDACELVELQAKQNSPKIDQLFIYVLGYCDVGVL